MSSSKHLTKGKCFDFLSHISLPKKNISGSSIPTLPNDKLILYSMRFCPYAQRVHLVLDAKRITYHTVFIDLTEKPEWFVHKSPLLKVPALELPAEKEPLIESLIICDYLDEKYPDVKLYPSDPAEKARDRGIVERFNLFINEYYPIQNKTAIDMDKAIAILFDKLDFCEDELLLRGSKYFGGEKAGMLDYMIWPWMERLEALSVYIGEKLKLDGKRFQKLVDWCAIMNLDDAVRKSVVTAEIYEKFWCSRQAGGRANYDLLV